jgi:hypothetical protein
MDIMCHLIMQYTPRHLKQYETKYWNLGSIDDFYNQWSWYFSQQLQL